MRGEGQDKFDGIEFKHALCGPKGEIQEVFRNPGIKAEENLIFKLKRLFDKTITANTFARTTIKKTQKIVRE